MYRRTKKYAARRQWRPRQEIPDDDQRPPRWQPPDLRRRITIEDFDGAEPMTHVIELHKTTRIDTYRAAVLAHHMRDNPKRRRVERIVSPQTPGVQHD